MNPILESLTGTNAMTDEIIASDLLIAAKAGVRNYAFALTETTSFEIRTVLRKHLDDAINMHEQVTTYMMEQGWYLAYDVGKQAQLDVQNAETALNLS
ncbi:spore coat protein [Alicyclobacillus curvatus]|nr:spore coat protein [Alicyclobacillus curvatus]